MSLTRKDIREKVVSILHNKTDAGTRVFPTQVRPVWLNQLPCILVYTPSDSRVLDSTPRRYKVTMDLRIEVVAQANDYLDDILDALGSQVEYQMAQDFTLGDLVENALHEATEMTIDKDGDSLLGSLVFNFGCVYYVSSVRDPLFLSELRRLDTDWRPNGATSASPETYDTATGFFL
jgi:hypothetical protein